MSIFDIKISNSFVKIDNHYEGTNKQQKEQDDTEEQDCDDSDSDHIQDVPINLQTEPIRDYTKSPLYEIMTYPEHAQYLLEWLHKNMDNQKSGRSIILPLKAVYEKGLFKTKIPYTAFVEEFGNCVSQTNYSRLMGDSSNYTNDELSLALEGIDLSIFKTKNMA
jgi:hypothetical protein